MRSALKVIAAGVGLTASVSAMSVPLSPLWTDWFAQAKSGFTFSAPGGVSQQDPMDMFVGGDLPTKLEWGFVTSETAPLSSLVVERDPQVEIDLNDPVLKKTGTLFHNNFPIGAPFLTDATLLSQIQLTATGLPTFVDAIEVGIKFAETPNRGDQSDIADPVGACAGGGISGEGDDVAGCRDIFVINVQNAEFNEAGQIVRQLGRFGDPDFLYSAIIEIAGAAPLTDMQCTAAKADIGCIGFVTEEGKQNSAVTSVGIFAREAPVPAPAPILGLGLGLLLMARARRLK